MGNQTLATACVSLHSAMDAFDRLPAEVREALRNSVFDWDPQTISKALEEKFVTTEGFTGVLVEREKKTLCSDAVKIFQDTVVRDYIAAQPPFRLIDYRDKPAARRAVR